MKIQAINQTNYLRTKNLRKVNNVPTTTQDEALSFKGFKGGAKGAAIGAAAATALGFLTGGFGFVLIPLWTVGGAIGGSAHEDENKPEEKDSSKKS